MKASNMLFLPKNVSQCNDSDFVKNYLIKPFEKGQVTFTPLGSRMVKNVTRIFEDLADAYELQRVGFPLIRPISQWKESGRYSEYQNGVFKLDDQYILAATDEEFLIDMMRNRGNLPYNKDTLVYDIGHRFRDGSVRQPYLVKAFIGMPIYTLNSSKNQDFVIENITNLYHNFFNKLGFGELYEPKIDKPYYVDFIYPFDRGPDKGTYCDPCSKYLWYFMKECECGNKNLKPVRGLSLGVISDKSDILKAMKINYSEDMKFNSCGLGLNRILYASIDNCLKNGQLNESLAPFKNVIVCDKEGHEDALDYYNKNRLDTLLDDRKISSADKVELWKFMGTPNIIEYVSGNKPQ
ncbi:hypothetical protein J4468_01425 [Candidatus Woesearchaeota archaeon]|nr:hypothetical protein [Candidatus Woesearchaeota archaeon]